MKAISDWTQMWKGAVQMDPLRAEASGFRAGQASDRRSPAPAVMASCYVLSELACRWGLAEWRRQDNADQVPALAPRAAAGEANRDSPALQVVMSCYVLSEMAC